ncbi:MAG TPA: endonuclease/exonuclease/phosphatase family protein [Candidatus Dormibacteraeota bacterium]|nr:endonuclease/exonuclease/phosphatase family protein [Candidatus Dormibacteraeota bacterium]
MAGSTVRVLTLNCLWRGQAQARLDAIGRLLNERTDDIVCLQEVTRRGSIRRLQGVLGSYGPAEFEPFGLAVMGGLVTFARHPVERTSYEVFRERGLRWDISWADRLLRKGFLTCRLHLDAVPVVVINTHLLANYDEDWTPSNRYARQQLSELDQLAVAIERVDPTAFLLVAGDLNLPATTPALEAFMSRCGLRNAFATAGPAPPTIRHAAPGKSPEAIDHILYRHPSGRELPVTARIAFVESVRLSNGRMVDASDHLAVEVEISLD